MLGNKNTNKKTVMGGVGIALLLCALMVGMTMTNLVQNDAPQVEAELAVANDDSDDFFALPDVYEPCLLYTSPSPRDATLSRMPSSA